MPNPKQSERVPVSAWKSFERRVAKYIGGGAERVPITGRQRGSEPDISHPWLSIECKYRKATPEWIKDAMRQAFASKKRPNDLPVVIIGEKGDHTGNAWVIVSLEDFRDRWL